MLFIQLWNEMPGTCTRNTLYLQTNSKNEACYWYEEKLEK